VLAETSGRMTKICFSGASLLSAGCINFGLVSLTSGDVRLPVSQQALLW